ncbi:MAG TPA: tRNA 2-thiouridine(34) synthase MnmA [Candidatus Binatia bacterium]|nr:tRNA 2-thiouridine(34) synthase MnmA [Candidatus Binatia bacterium]
MNPPRKKIVVAMSGGVDSSVSAALLIDQGFDVAGVSLRMWEGERGPRVCSDHRGAAEVAAHLGIPHRLLDLRREFADTVVKPFAREYLRGRTPNPCVACNRDFKFGALLRWAKEQHADYVATGHYARVVRDGASNHVSLLRGADRAKDQSYFLFALSREQLADTLFPLGAMQKSEVRETARRLGLPTAERPESQDICFGDYKALVASYAQESELDGGEVVDRRGNLLGRHGGVHRVTIGQRRGLGISASSPLYVVDIDEQSKRVVVGGKEELSCSGFIAGSLNWLVRPTTQEIAAEVQIRYRAPAVPCVVKARADGTCEVRGVDRFAAVTPGQAAVFYRGDQLLGGGWIERALRS